MSASTAPDLAAAFADPTVSRVTLLGSIALGGRELPLSGPGRSLALEGGCAPAPCAIDAGGLSRHFTVSRGASLSLARLTLANGATALHGGSALVRSAGSLSARDVSFEGASSGLDGGAVFAVAGAAVALTNSA